MLPSAENNSTICFGKDTPKIHKIIARVVIKAKRVPMDSSALS